MGPHGTAISCQSRIKSLTSCWVENKNAKIVASISSMWHMLPFIVPESFTNWWTLATFAWIDTKSFHLTHLWQLFRHACHAGVGKAQQAPRAELAVSPAGPASKGPGTRGATGKNGGVSYHFKVCCVTIERSVALGFFGFFPRSFNIAMGFF